MSATTVPRPRVPQVFVQLVRFGLVGATNTALTLATYAVLVGLHAPVALAGSGLNAALVSIAVSDQHLPRIAGELAVLPPVTVLTFVLCRGWVFAREAPA